MGNYETIHDRIRALVETFAAGKNTTFAAMVGSNEGNIRGYIKGVIPKQDVLEKIVRNIEVNPEWLLTGEGDMIRRNEGAAATVRERSSDRSSGVQKEGKSCSNGVQTPSDSMMMQLLEKITGQAEEIGRLKQALSEANFRADEAERRANRPETNRL